MKKISINIATLSEEQILNFIGVLQQNFDEGELFEYHNKGYNKKFIEVEFPKELSHEDCFYFGVLYSQHLQEFLEDNKR